MENPWSLLKFKVADHRPKTYTGLITAIEKEWNHLPQELASKLMARIERRVDSLFKANGDYIMY